MVEWKRMRIGDVLKEVSREKRLEPNTKYRLLGVKWYGKGVFLREEKYGKEIKATKLYKVKQGDFIYNRLFAWKSSFAIVTDEFDGCLVSNEFPLFTCCEGKLLPEFLLSYMLLPENIASVNNFSGGMSSVSRKRFKEKDFLNFEVPQYDIEIQSRICQRLKKMSELSITQDLESAHQLSLIKQLRQRILQDAVEGKLTAKWRDKHPDLISGDNHASKLLEKIKAEKERLIKERKIKKDKPLAPIVDAEKSFDLPEGWVWCRPSDLGFFTGGGTPNTSVTDYWNGNIPWITPKDMKVDNIYNSELKITKKGIENSNATLLPENTLIFVVRSGILKRIIPISISRVESTINQDLKAWFLCMSEMADFLRINIKGHESRLLRSIVKKGMTVESFDFDKFKCFPIPLPPLAEQQALIARVDKLMTIIDELEKQVSERKDQSEMLMQSVLREAFAQG